MRMQPLKYGKVATLTQLNLLNYSNEFRNQHLMVGWMNILKPGTQSLPNRFDPGLLNLSVLFIYIVCQKFPVTKVSGQEYSLSMDTFFIVGGLIMGGFIWFSLSVMFEEPALKRIREKKYGKGSTQKLSKEDRQSFYIPVAMISILLGLLVAYLGSKGLLPTDSSPY